MEQQVNAAGDAAQDDAMDPDLAAAFDALFRANVAAYERLGQTHTQAVASATFVGEELIRRTIAAHRGEGAAPDLEALLELPLRGTSEGTAGTAVGVA